jgi:hypothetical protein
MIAGICLMLSLSSLSSLSQNKNIVVDEDLSLTSEIFKVKIGSSKWGGIMRFKFGDYAVVESKRGWKVTNSKTNFINTKSEKNVESKFYFVLSDQTNDSAFVNAMDNVEKQEFKQDGFLNFFGVDPQYSETVMRHSFFTSLISTASNKEDTWLLLLDQTYGTEVESEFEGLLQNDERKISFLIATSNKNGDDERDFPALGYEFYENGVALCAVQYYGGGALGYNKNIIWLKSDLDARMKLILAAAMTSLMQYKFPS